MPPEPNADAAVRTERVLPASPQEVFAVFEKPDRLARWWGPKGFTNTFEQFEFVPGGRWVFAMHSPDGHSYPNESTFGDIERDALIVIEHIVKPRFVLTVTLTAHADTTNATHISWVQEFESPEIAASMCPISSSANEEVLDRLQAVLAEPVP